MNSNTGAIRNDKDLTVIWSASKEQPYPDGRIFKKILRHPKDHKPFEVKDGLIHYSTDEETRKLCIPHSEFQGRRLTELAIDQVHRTVGHMGAHITRSYACQYFWWPEMATDIKLFCELWSTCQTMKTSNQWPQDLLHSLPIPTQPWASISMDFMGPFPLTDNFNYIWVILCRLTSLVHLILL